MLSRNQRLPVKNFPINGFKRLQSDFFGLKIVKNNKKTNRFAVIIGKRFAKLATRRHYIKRLVLSQLAIFPEKGKDIIISASKSFDGVAKKDILEDIKKIKMLINL